MFRILLTHWHDFCLFRKDLSDEKLDFELEKQLRRHRQEEQRTKREAEKAKRLRGDVSRRSSELYDPFADDEKASDKQPSMSWTYSQHVANALAREEVLNQTDENTFASLQSTYTLFPLISIPL